MCGIIGAFAYQENPLSVDRSQLITARDTMFARGPDAAGFWEDDEHRIMLAHRRLSIIDLSEAAHQPFVSKCGFFSITFNGEIYNYQELKKGLSARGHQFLTTSDTEVLLAACIEYGAAVCNHLRGMFAFAFWNGHTKSLLLARDHFGIKPLYVAQSPGCIYFASQVAALLALAPFLRDTPSPAGHVGFFLWGHIPDPFTLYKGIVSLPSGTVMCIAQRGHITKKTYLDVSARCADIVDTTANQGDAAEEIFESVRHHLIADVPVGIFLSAGVDSSVVASSAVKVSNNVRTLTLGFSEFCNTRLDETGIARQNAELLRTAHSERWIRTEDFSQSIDALFSAMDQPTIDGVNTFFICREAKKEGLKVVLSGLGGDEMFRGYSSFQEVPKLNGYASKFGFLAQPVGSMLRKASWPFLRNSLHYKYAGALELGHTLEGAYYLRRGLFMPWELTKLFDNEFVKEGLAAVSPERVVNESYFRIPDTLLRIQALEMTLYLRDRLLKDCDWASMAHSVELRVPFVDARIFEAVLHAAAVRKPFGKRDLGKCMPPYISSIVFNRPKTGFNIPVQQWIMPVAGRKRLNLKRWAALVYGKKTGNSGYADLERLKKIT